MCYSANTPESTRFLHVKIEIQDKQTRTNKQQCSRPMLVSTVCSEGSPSTDERVLKFPTDHGGAARRSPAERKKGRGEHVPTILSDDT